MNKTMVELVKVAKVYPPDIKALENITFSVPNGDITFLTGMSGAGKTTLLKLICGMESPTNGFIEVLGKNMSQLKPKEIPLLRQQIGMAHQDFKLLPDRTAAQNIAMSMEVTYRNPSIIKRRVKDLLSRLMLDHKHDTLVSNLSRGEQQRVGVARAVANSPPLLLADEPTGNLDAAATELVMNLLEKCHDAGATIILATHHEAIYRDTKHRVYKLHQGCLCSSNPISNQDERLT